MSKNIFSKRQLETMIHFVCWTFVFCSPLLFVDHESTGINWNEFLRRLGMPIALVIVFYVNYIILVPRILLKDHTLNFFIINIILVLTASVFVHFWGMVVQPEIMADHATKGIIDHRPRGIMENRPHRRHIMPPPIFFYIQGVLVYALDAGLAVAVRMSQKWRKAENARKEAELGRTEAELKNLRSQINPHFLLNTLNNIYALISFDTEKAQQAVHDLSKLLRHVLYDNQQTFVELSKEIGFLKNYIDLMRIRLPKHVRLNMDFDVEEGTTTLIAPLIFISLIENAFKHGISPTEESYISIVIKDDDHKVECTIINSNFPKNEGDKSGSGIGLTQVEKRLELLYPGKYIWKSGKDESGKEYRSELIIDTI